MKLYSWYSELQIFLLGMVGFFFQAGYTLAKDGEDSDNAFGPGAITDDTATGPGGGPPDTATGPSAHTFQGTTELKNPLNSDISSIPAFFRTILDILLVFAVPFVVFFIILAGYKYVTARGNPTKISEAHQALLYAIIGGLLILGAEAILALIEGTVTQFAPTP